jgi:photosystem II stability/assembly factor-like uncharacterized protein
VGKVATVAVDWFNPKIIYLAGGGWNPDDSGSFEVDPNSSGIYVTKDGGAHWAQASKGLPDPYVYSLWVDPTKPSNAIAVSDLGVSDTSDWGASWTMTLPVSQIGVEASDLGFVSGSIYVADGSAIYQSNNDGQSWEVVETNPSGNYEHLSSNGTEVCATWSVQSVDTRGHVDCATSLGQWVTRTINGCGSNCDMNSLWLGPPTAQEIVVGDHGADWMSHNDGVSWQAFPNSSNFATEFQAMTIDPQNADVIWAANSDSALMKSTDFGEHWSPANSSGDIRVILPPPSGSSQFYLGTDQGLFRRVGNKPFAFKAISQEVRSSMVYSVAAAGSKILAVAQDYEPFVSNNAGHSWSQVPGGEFGSVFINYADPLVSLQSTDSEGPYTFGPLDSRYGVSSRPPELTNFVVAYSNPNIVYALRTTFNVAGGQSVLWRSNNWGLTWRSVAQLPSAMNAIAVDPQDPSSLLAIDATANHHWTTSDGGQTWQSVTDSCTLSTYVATRTGSIISWNPANANQVITTTNTGSSVCISTDGGKTFTVLDGGFAPPFDQHIGTALLMGAQSIWFVPGDTNGASFALVPEDGLLYSPELGQPWSPVTTNIVARDMTAIAWSKGHLLLSTYGQGIVESNSIVDSYSAPAAPSCKSTSRSESAVTFRWTDGTAVSGPPTLGYVVTPMTKSGKVLTPTWVSAPSNSATITLPMASKFHATITSVNDVGPSVGCVTGSA